MMRRLVGQFAQDLRMTIIRSRELRMALMKDSSSLAALALCAFGVGITEFAPMGLLPLIASDLAVTIPTAGLLVTGYAVGVMLGAPVVTLLTLRIPRKTLLI